MTDQHKYISICYKYNRKILKHWDSFEITAEVNLYDSFPEGKVVPVTKRVFYAISEGIILYEGSVKTVSWRVTSILSVLSARVTCIAF